MRKDRIIWERPWRYKEGILISTTLLVIGFMLEYTTGGQGVVKLLRYPNNIYIAIGLLIFLILLTVVGRKSAVVEWLGSVPAAISSVGLLLFITLLMGLTLQYDGNAPRLIREFGLSHILTSWPYLLSNLFLLICLGVTTIRNLLTFQWRKVGFIISHIGLWIVLFGANFGSIQVQRLQMKIHEGGIANTAYDMSTRQIYEMPFSIKLEDFILDEYNPKLAIVSHETGTIVKGNGTSLMIADSGVTATLDSWDIEIKEYIYSSAKAGDQYYFINETGAAPSVYVKATHKQGNKVEGWVSCGSFNRPYESLKLSNDYSLVMLFPESKEFTSKIEIYTDNRNPIKVNLEVNKPVSVGGWKIYQLSYNTELGRWSDTSTLELVSDPWLSIVYLGIFLMLGGAIYMFWAGSKKQSKGI